MDAYGNLTELSEFAGGRRIRLVSYLGEDVAMGAVKVPAQPDGWSYRLGVRHVSIGDHADSIFAAISAPYWNNWFALAWAGGDMPWTGRPTPSLYISSLGGEGTNGQAFEMCDPMDGSGRPIEGGLHGFGPPSLFQVEFVNGCWFTLNFARVHPQDQIVFDCSRSNTSEGNPIFWFPANGGDNQTWRAGTVGPGL